MTARRGPAARRDAARGDVRKPGTRARPSVTAAWLAEDRRLASLHLRVGALALARAELEDFRRRGDLDVEGDADLAEARWRSGDLEGAAAAAGDHLSMGGSRSIAIVIAAEAAAAAGHPVEARAHVEALGSADASTLEALFAGMPRRAFWPSAPGIGAAVLDQLPPPAEPRRRRPGALVTGAARAAGAVDEGAAGALSDADPVDELALARDELANGAAADAARGIARLALVLRLDPSLAPAVLGALGRRRDPAGLTVEGDACRLLGRHLEAEAAFAAARRALGDSGPNP